MQKERPEPRSKFTFFPYNNEEQMVANSSIDDLEEQILSQPDLTIQYLHELWRTGRSTDVRAIGERIGSQLLDKYYTDYDMGIRALMWSTREQKTDDEIQTFIFETNLQFIGGMMSESDEDEEFRYAITEITIDMMKLYNDISLQYAARLN